VGVDAVLRILPNQSTIQTAKVENGTGTSRGAWDCRLHLQSTAQTYSWIAKGK
jgi:hypothetical protein